MSRIGLANPDGTINIVSWSDGLDAPYCPGPECFVHADSGAEHHVEGCPVYGSWEQAVHRLDDAMLPLIAAIEEELRRTLRGRAALRLLWLRAHARSTIHRARYRAWYWRRRLVTSP